MVVPRRCLATLAILFGFSTIASGQVLNPPYFNLAEAKIVTATSTCGEQDGQPIRELYCSLAGATRYSPYEGYFSYNFEEGLVALRVGGDDAYEARRPLLQGGQNCEYCDASTPELSHPASFMVDGSPRYWQSPPLSRGMEYNQVNLTIDLEQEFHVAYVSIQMANSPRPGLWVLERSTDHGKTFSPWQYFAETPAQCEEFFGPDSLQPIMDDDSVICTTEYSQIVPLENGQIFVTLLNNRPGRGNFSHSDKLQRFTRATNVRIRLLRTKTLQGHLMDLNDKKDPTITRRYFYSVKEIEMGGRCVCHGHAQTCDILDPLRPNHLLCRCEHNTCGDRCEKCCPGFEQKQWQPVREGQVFQCEPCNCLGHGQECEYDPEVDKNKQSLDIHGNYEGGGVCKNCQHNTHGINCDKCVDGFFRPLGRSKEAPDACIPCQCNSPYFNGNCDPETGKCHCAERFTSPDCDSCSYGFYGFPECKKCSCFLPGTNGDLCLPDDGQCNCKANFEGTFCDRCAEGFYNFSSCAPCHCEEPGSIDQVCNKTTAQCSCKSSYTGRACESCADGYYDYPKCEFCNCDSAGVVPAVCEKSTGICICKPGYVGLRCDRCDSAHYGFPNCQSCECDLEGSATNICNPSNGQCQCKSNYSGRKCDKCSVGHYLFPKCLPCECNRHGSMGSTCDDHGQCFCKPNFIGAKCDKCQENFFNFPLCEECNCDPRGVSHDFAGCDKVPQGELCSCKQYVTGRRCDRCKPFYWNLQYHSLLGCEPCSCHIPGSLSSLTDCSHVTGQCQCKTNVMGRDCSQCKDGFYSMSLSNPFGCRPCECDIGGSYSNICDPISGQCHCKPRVSGRTCAEPIEAHFFPTLQHMKYEAEDGLGEDLKSVRYASDVKGFRNFSGKGYVVFSPIQTEIQIPIQIVKSSVYRLMVHYVNASPLEAGAKFSIEPHISRDREVLQEVDVRLPKTTEPLTYTVGTGVGQSHPFVLNPGRWTVKINTPNRIFLDYIVLMPEFYLDGKMLHASFLKPCLQARTPESVCETLLYPTVSEYPTYTHFDITERADVEVVPMKQYPSDIPELAQNFGWINSNNPYTVDIGDIPYKNYTIVMDYQNFSPQTVKADVDFVSNVNLKGSVTFEHCPYSTFCRVIVSDQGQPMKINIDSSNSKITLQAEGESPNIGLKSVTLVPFDHWNMELILPKPKCVMVNSKCVGYSYITLPDSSRFEAESTYRNKSVSGANSEIEVDDPNIIIVPVDNSENSWRFSGKVPRPDKYAFIFHYYNPQQSQLILNTDVKSFKNESQFVHEVWPENAQARISFNFCPSISGCRTVLYNAGDQRSVAFDIDNRFVLTVFTKNASRPPVYVDYLLVVPFNSYSEDANQAIPTYSESSTLANCSQTPGADSMSEECLKHIFSLTVDFNAGAMSCDCNLEGSTSFVCQSYGGQCSCKKRITGRQCDRCEPGHFGFPNCKPCNCGANRQCDSETGQCFCPPLVEGDKCERCQPNAFGFDPLIGCQSCKCSAVGTVGQSLNCDQLTGQCLCKSNVGGRRCERCLAGHYGYPHCYECACEISGSRPEICDQSTAECLCKDNVIGSTCASCASSTFNLQRTNPKGCTDCFCFGITDHCQSSAFKKSVLFNMFGWKVPGMTGKVSKTEVDGKVEFQFDPTLFDGNSSKLIYLAAPSTYLGNRLLSYGGKIQYFVSATSMDEGGGPISLSSDVILKGNNMTIEFWMENQPTDFDSFFHVQAPIFSEKWVQENGDTVSRANMLMILQNVTALLVKASYYAKVKSITLKTLSIDTADASALVEAGQAAMDVELCNCPPPYKGTSCENCAEGYYRVRGGPYLGSCVPCKCHGHSMSCDQFTGQCFNCQHNTTGTHCEFCDVGLYGDATIGSPLDCQICPCPHATVENNFAEGCNVTKAGNLLACHCRQGYTGDRCQLCATGWFGQPYRPGGKCQPCFCNENNDLSVENSCDPENGRCLSCLSNTDGFYCELCKPWFYGDALEAKNCSACSCNQCGADWCDGKTGHCDCKPNVEGDNCEHCVPNSWGFSYCQGCQMCNCANASQSEQCNLETGQCPCKSGAAGLFCERCADGYWNYTNDGCLKCDCESDLAMGTICDPTTGQCQCMEGATGIRCDFCLPGYTMVPGQGCLVCDECVTGLAGDQRSFGDELSKLENSMDNLTGAQVSSRRFRRLLGDTSKFKDLLSFARSLTSNDRIKSFDEVDEVIFKLDRLVLDAVEAKNTSSSFTASGYDKHRKIRILNLRLKDLVEKLHLFADSLESRSTNNWSPTSEDNLLRLTRDFVLGMKISAIAEQKAMVEMEIENARNMSDFVKDFVEKSEKLLNGSAQSSTLLSDAEGVVKSLQEHLDQSRRNSELAEMNCARIEIVPVFNHLPQSNTSNLEKALSEAYEFINNAREIMTVMKDGGSEVSNYIVELEKLQPVLNAKLAKNEQSIAKLRNSKMKAMENVENLINRTDECVETFSKNEKNVKEAMDAANAYRFIIQELGNASAAATEIAQLMTNRIASYSVEAALKELKENADESIAIVREATDVRSNIANRMRKDHSESVDSMTFFEQVVNSSKEILDRSNNEITKFQQVRTRVALARIFASDSMIMVKANQEKITKQLEEHDSFVNSARDKIANQLTATSYLKRASANTKLIDSAVPELLRNVSALRQAFVKSVTSMNSVETGIALLREKLARTRNLANMIKLGVQFHPNSSLELYNYNPLKAVEAQTEISLFFRTSSSEGTLFFLGNELGTAKRTGLVPTDDFLAVDIVDGKPRVLFDLGSGPASVIVDKVVSDNRWHRASLQRIGKLVTLKITSEGEPEAQAEIFSRGSKTILNLAQNVSRFFVGGMPDSFKAPDNWMSPNFVGQIESLVFHGQPKSLWNFALDGRSDTYGAPERQELKQLSQINGVHLNGQGFIVMRREMWNPRMQTNITFYFKTHVSTGLLFFMAQQKDFFAVEIMRGQVRLQYNLGSGAVLLSTSRKYNDGQYHRVTVKRDGKSAVLSVDLADSVEGNSPGTLSHLDVTDVFYVGGVPSDLLASGSTVVRQGFHGCIERMSINGNNINLNRHVQAFFIESGCPERPIRLVAFDRPGGMVKFSKLLWNADTEVGFRFRTTVSNTWLLYVTDQYEMNTLWIALRQGSILIRNKSAGKYADIVRLDAINFADGQWHYLSANRIGQELILDADDLYTSSTVMDSLGVYAQSENTMQMGTMPPSLSIEDFTDMDGYVGCIADVTYNRRMLNFAQSERRGEYISFDVCPEDLFPNTRPLDNGILEELTDREPTALLPSAKVESEESTCALRTYPVEHMPCGGNCHRFGTEVGSRLEFEVLSSAIDAKSEISLDLRLNAFNGFVLFAWDRKRDFITLYAKDGKLVFEYDCGSGPAVLESKSGLFDYQWHYVKLIRNGRNGQLWIDDIMHAEGQSHGLTTRVELQRPFYVGGIPDSIYRTIEKRRPALQSINPIFSGCLRNLLLNNVPFGQASNSVGVFPCDNDSEGGFYFGEGSSYILVPNAIQAEKKLVFSVQVKPRSFPAVLFVVASHNGNEVIAAFAMKGVVILTIQQGSNAPQILTIGLRSPNSICDGHWHTIRMLKVKNFLTFGIDGANKYMQIKKNKAGDGAKSRHLYLGGLPESFSMEKLSTNESYVGCMREISIDQSNGQKQKLVDLKHMQTHGDVTTKGCPVD